MTRGPLRGTACLRRGFGPRCSASACSLGWQPRSPSSWDGQGATTPSRRWRSSTLAVAELLLVFSIRAVTRLPWRVPRNRYLESAVLVSILILVAAVYVPLLHGPLGTVSLGPFELGTALALAVLPAAFVELAKAFRSRLR